MKDKNIVHYTHKTLPKGKTDWQKIVHLSDDDIEAAAREDDSFWTEQMLNEAHLKMPQKKISVHMYLDQDIIDWFKAEGKGYQSRINAVLKSYVHEHV